MELNDVGPKKEPDDASNALSIYGPQVRVVTEHAFVNLGRWAWAVAGQRNTLQNQLLMGRRSLGRVKSYPGQRH